MTKKQLREKQVKHRSSSWCALKGTLIANE